MSNPNRIFFTNGNPNLMQTLGWDPVGMITDDGIQIDELEFCGVVSPARHLTYPARQERTFTFDVNKKTYRYMMNTLFGKYRLPGDKPLLHNGRKPR